VWYNGFEVIALRRRLVKFIFGIIIIIILIPSIILLIPGKKPDIVKHIKGKFLFGIKVDKVVIQSDKDEDKILDLDDIVEGARLDAKNKPTYRSAYYAGGYPPDNEGVCTDVVWRAFKNAGYALKDMVDKDIRENTSSYPGVNGKPDPNIDFRRVRNLYVFFKKYGENLTLDIKPYDAENLKEWQGGDIVTFTNHIAIISDKRRKDGVPYIIHNSGPYTREEDGFLLWEPQITGHFRFPNM